MKNKNLPLILIVIALVIGLMAAIYISGASPAYNGVLDTVFSDIAGIFKSSSDDAGTVPDQKAAEKKETAAKKRTQKDGVELTNGGYAVASVGKVQWLYESNWPFVTAPLIHDGTVISITSEPAIIGLSQENGGLVFKQDCPVYPSETAYFDGDVLILTGRDGNTYRFSAAAGEDFAMLPPEEDNIPGGFLSQFAPSVKTADFIETRIKEWSEDDSRVLPELELYTGHITQEGNGNYPAQQTNGNDTVMYIFAPNEQGIYQIGLSDEKGSWLNANAFVAVFGESGDLKAVSLDYVANKPVVKLHLSETELYYIVAGWAKDMYDGSDAWLQIAESH